MRLLARVAIAMCLSRSTVAQGDKFLKSLEDHQGGDACVVQVLTRSRGNSSAEPALLLLLAGDERVQRIHYHAVRRNLLKEAGCLIAGPMDHSQLGVLQKGKGNRRISGRREPFYGEGGGVHSMCHEFMSSNPQS